MVAGEIAQPVEVLVLGGGPGGYTAAAQLAEQGKHVVLIEAGPLGGTCLNVGCIPSKAIIALAHDFSRARCRLGSATGLTGSIEVDLEAGQAWKAGIVERLRSGVAELLGRVEVVEGTGRFIGPDRVAVESADHVSHFRFEHAIIATGSRPAGVAALPIDGRRVVDSTGALMLGEVPPKMTVVGGGYIGIELGMAYAMLGSHVTVVELTDRLLAGFDADIVAVVRRRMDDLGMTIKTGARVTGDDGTHVLVDHAGSLERHPADVVLVAVGRRPNTDDLQLEDVGLTVGPTGLIAVDEQRRTSSARIFAIGDVVEGAALAHKAAAEGRVAAEAICGLPTAFDQLVPLVAFCDPELGAVGSGEDEARAAGIDVVVGKARFAANGRALTLGQPDGLVKVIVERATGVVLGVQVAGPSASDLVAEAAVVVECGLRAEDIAGTIHAHPTLAEAVGDAAAAAVRRLTRR